MVRNNCSPSRAADPAPLPLRVGVAWPPAEPAPPPSHPPQPAPDPRPGPVPGPAPDPFPAPDPLPCPETTYAPRGSASEVCVGAEDPEPPPIWGARPSFPGADGPRTSADRLPPGGSGGDSGSCAIDGAGGADGIATAGIGGDGVSAVGGSWTTAGTGGNAGGDSTWGAGAAVGSDIGGMDCGEARRDLGRGSNGTFVGAGVRTISVAMGADAGALALSCMSLTRRIGRAFSETGWSSRQTPSRPRCATAEPMTHLGHRFSASWVLRRSARMMLQ